MKQFKAFNDLSVGDTVIASGHIHNVFEYEKGKIGKIDRVWNRSDTNTAYSVEGVSGYLYGSQIEPYPEDGDIHGAARYGINQIRKEVADFLSQYGHDRTSALKKLGGLLNIKGPT